MYHIDADYQKKSAYLKLRSRSVKYGKVFF